MSGNTEGDIEELERWVDENIARLCKMLVVGVREDLERAGASGMYDDQTMAEAQAHQAANVAEFEGFQQKVVDARQDGPPWSLWEETFGRLPTPGLLLVERTMAESGSAYPTFLKYQTLSRWLFLSSLADHAYRYFFQPSRDIAIESWKEVVNEMTPELKSELNIAEGFELESCPVDVAEMSRSARRTAECFDASYDDSARSHFRALVDHPNVDGEKLRAFLETMPFQSDEEWNATFEGALDEARAHVGAAATGHEASAVSAAFRFVSVVTLLPMDECWGMYQEIRAEHVRHGEESLIPDIDPC